MYRIVKTAGKTVGNIGKGLEAWRKVVTRMHPYNTTSAFDIKKRIDGIKPATTWEHGSGEILEFEELVREWEEARNAADEEGKTYSYDPLDMKITLVEVCPLDLQDRIRFNMDVEGKFSMYEDIKKGILRYVSGKRRTGTTICPQL